MTSRLRAALLTGTVAAALALGSVPAHAGNQEPTGQPAPIPGDSAPAPGPDAVTAGTVASEAGASTPVEETAAAEPVQAEPEEALADAVVTLLVEAPATDNDGEPSDGAAGAGTAGTDEAADPIDSGAGGEAVPAEDASAEESAPTPAPDMPTTPAAEPAPAVDPATEAAPAPAAPPVIESIVVNGRTLTHRDFNIPDDIAASDEETVMRWMEENMDLVLESEGMTYLLDLMLEYLMAGDLDGLAALIREMSASDPEAGEELILWMYELFEGIGEWPGDFGEWPVAGEPGPEQPAKEPAAVVIPASQPQPAAPSNVLPVAVPAGALADTGAAGTAWLASGGVGLLVLGSALLWWRRRTA